MTGAAIIVAAGKGLRAGGDIPKQYQTLAGMPVLAHTIRAFAECSCISRILVVLNPDDLSLFQKLVTPALSGIDVEIADGGETRQISVANGLAALDIAADDVVLIHDGARPLIDSALITRVLTTAAETGAAAPARPVTDTLWRADSGKVTGSADRSGLMRAQTPQGFRIADIAAAHQAFDGQATDDVEIALAAGIEVSIVAGSARNIKITDPADFARAEEYLRGPMDIRTGNGFDVHAFCQGDHVMLGGVKIDHDQGLKGHSDADVAMHALTDAIYGALGEGDIGRWFPPDEAEWKGAPSDIFLRHAVSLAAEQGFTLTHCDCTIICEQPKIGPHARAIRNRLADITGIEVNRISVKATTSERLGFTGRGEGIATLATATLVKS